MSFYRCCGSNKGGNANIEDWWTVTSRASTPDIVFYHNGEYAAQGEAVECIGAAGPFIATYSGITGLWTLNARDGYNITFCSEELPVSWKGSSYKEVLCLCE